MNNATLRQHVKVLVIDDNPDFVIGVKMLLVKENVEVHTATDGFEGLNKAKKILPDIVLLDVVMPRMDGIEVCKAIRQTPQLAGTVIIMLSGLKTQTDQMSEGLEAGADCYIARPIPNRELLARIRAFIRLKKTEKALNEADQRFRTAQEMSPDGFTLLHPERNQQNEVVDFTWIYENETIARINGTDPQKVTGKRLLELFPSHRATPVFDAYVQVANTGKSQIIEEVYVGDIVEKPTWLRLVVVSMGEDIAILGQDITKRKMAEDALFKSESVTKALLDGIPESAFLTDTQGTVIAANATVAQRLNKKKSDLIGSNVFNAVPKDVADLRWTYFESAIQTGKQVRFQDVSFDRIIDNRVNPIIGMDGKVSTIAIIGIDITERIQAEKALEESERTFRKLFEDSSDAILLLDANHTFVECNRATLQLLKMTRDEFLFLKPEDISPEFQPSGKKSKEAAKEMIELAYTNEQHRFDWTHIDAEGREFVVDISLMPIAVKGKTMLHITWRNITERKKAEHALRDSEARYRMLTENILDVIWIIDAQTLQFLYVIPSVERLRGFTPEEIMKYPLDHALSEEHRDYIRGLIHRDTNR
jgi:PAS domain S-box-containing protein